MIKIKLKSGAELTVSTDNDWLWLESIYDKDREFYSLIQKVSAA